jgi:hypothetical protein
MAKRIATLINLLNKSKTPIDTSNMASMARHTSFGKIEHVNRWTVSVPIISAGLKCGKNFKAPNNIKMKAIENLRKFSRVLITLLVMTANLLLLCTFKITVM